MFRSAGGGPSCFLVLFLFWFSKNDAYFISRSYMLEPSLHTSNKIGAQFFPKRSRDLKVTLAVRDTEEEEVLPYFDPEADELIVIRGSEGDDFDGAIWEDLETGQPPKWLIMKELLGINVFTYILAALIMFFLSMNWFVGPGWLGQLMGMPGVGEFSEVSKSFPDTIDLSSPEFRL